MDLSVIIVNYNVRFFLEHCLFSVFNASKNLDIEIFVVDNNSADGSCFMIRAKFPLVKLIENNKNLGFSCANNQALRIAQGRYCILLNPDTVVEEDTFDKCVHFMNEHPDAGALGVKMIDGKGDFLPESKRSLPTPTIAFFKIFGFSYLFPRSRIFGRYHLGFLHKEEIHKVEVISGAFMCIRKKALGKTGLLDEDFFMYGEDIDISYRLLKSGYNNYYFPETTIIHFKGESTKKGSLNYVFLFYKAMKIFAEKHFTKNKASLFSFLINMAIYFRAILSVAKRFIHNIYPVLIDSILIYTGFLAITPLWEIFMFGNKAYYPEFFFMYIIPAYIVVWILAIYFSGGYEKPLKLWSVVRGYLSGTIIILIFYALLPENLRTSRVMIFLGTVWGIIIILLHRIFLSFLKIKDYELSLGYKRRVLIAGGRQEAKIVADIMEETNPRVEIVGFISNDRWDAESTFIRPDNLKEAVRINKADEIIFCAADIPSNVIIAQMSILSGMPVDFKIALPGSASIIGSNSIETTRDLHLIAYNSIGKSVNKRIKRVFDVLSSLIIIFGFPIFVLILRSYLNVLVNCFKVLFGGYTWVGYCRMNNSDSLPPLKKSIYSISDGLYATSGSKFSRSLNEEYARNYKVYKDVQVLWRNMSKILQFTS